MDQDTVASGKPIPETSSQPAHKIVGGGQMGALVRNKDWSTTPLGPIDQWSETLLSCVNLVLSSPLPATLSWGEDLTFLCNDAAIPTLGERHPAALGCSYRDVFADAWHLVGPDMQDCFLRGRSPVRENVSIPLNRNGGIEEGYYTFALVPVYESGSIVGVYNPYQNTTQTVIAQRERTQQEERLNMALSAANGVGIWDWDIPRNLVFTDGEFATMYGVDPADAVRGVSLAAFTAHIHKDDAVRVGREISDAVKACSEFASEYRLVLHDGSVRWVFAKGRCYRDEHGKPSRFPGVTIDITARKAMEDALVQSAEHIRQNKEKFRTFVEAVSDVVYRVSADWSEALEVEGRGFLPDTHEPDPEWFTRNVHPDDQVRVRAAIDHSIRESSIFEMEHKVQRLDGTEGWTFSRAIPVRDQHGKVLEWFGAATDITARKQAEHALLRTEKLAVVGRLASSIAHEINNPLEAVINLLYIAEQTADAQTKQLLEAAQDELRRVSHITTNTLQFNRQKSVREPVDICSTVQSVLDLYRGRFRQAGVEALLETRDCPSIHALAGEIRQVFANLIGNALDALKQGGRLKIRIRPCTLKNSPAVRVTVADDGHGMSAATRQQIFKPFFTTKESTGTGLGLWISADIIERHGGVAMIRSSTTAPFRGTTFSVVLPLSGLDSKAEPPA